MFKLYQQSFAMRRMISVSIALTSSALCGYYFLSEGAGFTLLTAFLTSQTSRGTPFRQNLLFLLTIFVAFLSAFYLTFYLSIFIIYLLLVVIFLLIIFAIFYSKLLHGILYKITLYFALVAFVTLVNMPHIQSMQMVLAAISLGGLIGIFCSSFILPVRPYMEFRSGILPVLHASENFLATLTHVFSQQATFDNLEQRSIAIERVLQAQNHYPQWIYEVGFNPGLRSGFRFFLINIERMTEILFAMNYLLKQEQFFPDKINILFAEVTKQNQQLLASLIAYFANLNSSPPTSDYTSDMVELEEEVKKIIPHDIELLDVSPVSLAITELVYRQKDLRALLLQLMLALPKSN